MSYFFNETLLDQIVSGTVDKQQRSNHNYSSRLSPDDTRTVIVSFPEKLAVALWPNSKIADRPEYGRALLWEFEASGEGLVEAFEWILNATKAGRYDDLSGLKFRAEAKMKAIKDAAANMSISRLVTVADAGLRRLQDGTQVDASESIKS